jgi:hypothetical protein
MHSSFTKRSILRKQKSEGDRHPYRYTKLHRIPIRDRPTLAHVKRVYGVAFSGYNDFSETTQADIIDEFIKEADNCDFDSSKMLKARRSQLHQSSKHIVDLLRTCIGHEVEKYLMKIESVLFDPKTNISFDLTNNNCQRLVSALLGGKDFEYFFPRFPERLESTLEPFETPEWPQYLVSFGEHLARTKAEFYEESSIVERFLAKYREYDLIDFLEYNLDRSNYGNANPQISKAKSLYLLIAPEGTATTYDLTNTLWEMPRDTLAILQSHLHRPVWKYRTESGQLLDDQDLLRNRLLLLEQLDMFNSLAGSLGNIIRSRLLQTPEMVKRIFIPKAHAFTHFNANDKVRIIRTSPVNVLYAILRSRDSQLKDLFKLPDQ